MRPSRHLVLASAVVAVALAAPSRATAHALEVEVTRGPERVRVVAGYDDGTPAELAKVTVTDGAGNEVASGTLDEKGVWSFPRPPAGTYKVTVELAGHRTRKTIRLPEAGADDETTTSGGWRPDRRVGLAIGVAGLLGGTALYVLVRRPRAPAPPGAS